MRGWIIDREVTTQSWRKTMKGFAFAGLIAAGAVGAGGCTADWATQNASPFIMEIAGISPSPMRSDVRTDGTIFNDDAQVSVNIFRKNNNGTLGTSPAEHIYMERYDVRFFRTDGRNLEGVDVPYRISGPLGNVRFHTPGPGGSGEVGASMTVTVVRHQAKYESPLTNLAGGGGAIVVNMIAEVTIHARTVQGQALETKGQLEIRFADFVD